MQRIDKNRFGPWAIVTGASSGIGKAFASHLAANGFNVVLVARRQAILEEIGQELAKEYGIQYRAMGIDLSEEDFIPKIDAVTRDLDIGLVVSNAGATIYGEFLTLDQHSLQHSLHLNVTAHLDLVHHFGQHLIKRGRGGVLLVSSAAGLQGTPYMADYAAAKAYILSLGEALHIEFEKYKVNVTVLLPGPTDTPMIADSGTLPSDMPMKIMSPEQCAAEGLAALSANRSSHITGAMMRLMLTLTPRSVRPKMLGNMVAKGLARLKTQSERVSS